LEEARKFTSEIATLKVIDADISAKYEQLRDGFEQDMAAANGPLGRQMVREQHAKDLDHLALQYERFGAIPQAGAMRARAGAMRGDEGAATVSSADEAFTGSGPTDRSGRSIGAGDENGALVQATLADRAQLELIAKGGTMLYAPNDDPNLGRLGEMMERVVAPGSEDLAAGTSGGSHVLKRRIAYGGGQFTYIDGTVDIPKGFLIEGAVEMPVVVTVPNPTDPADLLNQGTLPGGGLMDTGNLTRQVGTYTDWGNGEVVYGSPAGPGGLMIYSTVPPYQGYGVRSIEVKNGVLQVQYDPAAIAAMDAASPGSLLVDVTDPDTGQPKTDAAGNPLSTLDTRGLAGGSTFFSPNFDPEAPTPPSGDQTRANDPVIGLIDNPPEGIAKGLWMSMVADVRGGMDPGSSEFRGKYARQLAPVAGGVDLGVALEPAIVTLSGSQLWKDVSAKAGRDAVV
jgi:hypothetical protein